VVTTDSLGFREQANCAPNLVNQVAAQMSAQREAESATLQVAEPPAHQDQANSAQQKMMEQMQLLMSTVLQTQSQQANSNRRSDGGRGPGGDRRNPGRRRDSGHGDGERLLPGYCWTHGHCCHKGVVCEAKSVGHNATYENTQGGSQHRFWLL
jgi:hypothetical protein